MEIPAIITARRDSVRIPRKNHQTVGGYPLWLRAAMFARFCGLRAIVDSDDEQILADAAASGYETHVRTTPSESQGGTHWQALHAAACDLDLGHYVLLQPTSPFRSAAILSRCLLAHDDEPGRPVLTSEDSRTWDGNIGIFHREHREMPKRAHCQTVRNVRPYAFQIDRPGDVEEARELEMLLVNGGLW